MAVVFRMIVNGVFEATESMKSVQFSAVCNGTEAAFRRRVQTILRDEYGVVGVTERFTESVAALHYECNFKNVSHWPVKHVVGSVHTLDESTRTHVLEMNALDVIVWQ